MIHRTIKGLRAALLLVLVVLGLACVRGGGVPTSLENVSVRRAPLASQLRCEGDAFRIDLLGAIDAIPDDTLDAQREQLRDWIWMTTLGRIAPRTSVDNVFSGVMDQPLLRDDSLAHVLRLPVGPTRAATTKKGDVIVLVEAAGEAAMAAEVLETIDDEALSLGHTPEQVEVYGYELRPSVAEASVCKIGRFDRAKLEGAAQAYRSATITTAADLDQFLSGGVDLLSAQCTATGLQVAGRQRPRNTRTQVTVEHVAALAQELGTRYIPPARFGVTLASLPKEEREDIEARARRFDALLAAGPGARSQFRAETANLNEDMQRFFRSVLGWKDENPAVPMTEILLSFALQRMLDGKPGFSLDPVNTAERATKSLDEALDALSDRGKIEGLLRGWGAHWAALRIHNRNPDKATLAAARARLEDVRVRLRQARDEDVEAALFPRMRSPTSDMVIASDIGLSVWGQSAQQCARYDGPLAGTATGMTFFYTDLLAKLWTRGQKEVSPEGEVDGFESIVHHANSTAWCEEEGRRFTRLWFGVRDEGYARERSGGVRFAPTATRLFAKGSTPGSGEGEAEPNARHRRFILWWDRHFAQLAEWEPQYETLNQIMKWSVVMQSARIGGDRSCLRFLQGVPVKNDQHFAQWVTETRNLKWRGPVNLVPAPLKATECLPLLTSEPFDYCGDVSTLVGGVGAASLKQVAAKPLRSAETPDGFGRFASETRPVTVEPNRLQLDKITRSGGGELHAVEIAGKGDRVTFRANIDTNASQRGTLSSSSPYTPVRTTEMSVESNAKGLALQQRNNGQLSTELRVSDYARADVQHADVLHVEVKPGVLEQAKSVSKKLADHMAHHGDSLADAARTLPRELEPRLTGDGKITVLLRREDGTKVSAVMESGGGNRGPPDAEASFIIGTPEGGSYRPGMGNAGPNKPIQVSIRSENSVNEQGGEPLFSLDETPKVVREKLGSGDHAGAMQAFERRPTASAAEPLLEDAIKRGDVTSLDRMVETLKNSASTEDLAGMHLFLDRQRVLIQRMGGDPSKVVQRDVKLAIEQTKRLMPGKTEADTIRTLAQRQSTPTYRPATSPAESALPPAIHPRGKPLSPEEEHVTRILNIPSDLELPQTLRNADGIELRLQGAPGGAPGGPPRDPRRAASTVGSATRLFFPMWPILIVTPCSDTNKKLPPCHEPDEDRPTKEQLQRMVCDQDHDGALTTPAERACVTEMPGCDRDGDGLWLTRAELSCLGALRRKHAAPPPPTQLY